MRLSLIFMTFCSLVFFGCSQKPSESTIQEASNAEKQKISTTLPGPFAHTVYFWLKEPNNQAHRGKFLKSLRTFIDASPNIETQHIGAPAATSRSVIDNTYTFSLLLSFKDATAEKAYQDEAAHKKFIAECEDLWEKVLVYDSELLK